MYLILSPHSLANPHGNNESYMFLYTKLYSDVDLPRQLNLSTHIRMNIHQLLVLITLISM